MLAERAVLTELMSSSTPFLDLLTHCFVFFLFHVLLFVELFSKKVFKAVLFWRFFKKIFWNLAIFSLGGFSEIEKWSLLQKKVGT